MKHYRLYIPFLVLFCLSSVAVNALQLASAKALRVEGTVNYGAGGAEEKPLTEGTILTEGERITTSNSSSVHLKFSNGSELTIGENSNLLLSKLEQGSFPGINRDTYPEADPSKSISILELNYGKVLGNVKQLRRESEFKIKTLFGTASISDARYGVGLSYDASSNQFNFDVQNIDGVVHLTSPLKGSAKFGRSSNIVRKFNPDTETRTVFKLPPTHTIKVTQSGADERFSNLINEFPQSAQALTSSPSSSPLSSPVVTPLPLEAADQDIIVISPDS